MGDLKMSAEHSWQVALVANLFQDYFPEKFGHRKSDFNAFVP